MQIEHNFNKAAQYIRSAAIQGAELAVLPGKLFLITPGIHAFIHPLTP